MKLKLRKIKLDAGRPIVFLHEDFAKKINIHAGDRIEIHHNGKRIFSVIDTIKGIIKTDEIVLSQEILDYFPSREGSVIEVRPASHTLSDYLIAKKVSGKHLTSKEIFIIINDIVFNALTEAEIAYFISAVYEKGMSLKETIALTEAIYKTGKVLHWGKRVVVDKHSIGGIPGNRTTPIVVSICAAAGLIMPKTSSRAITSPAGTADVIETIAKVDFSVEKLQEIVKKTGACLAWGGSLGLAPADDKLIRVERLLDLDPESQLIASILAKKLAAGSTNVLIDIPYGEGAKVKKIEAKKLKQKFLRIANSFKIKLRVVLTDGSQPIGNGIGPILEMQDILKVLQRRDPPQDLEKKALILSGEIFEMVGESSKGEGYALAKNILDSGKAYKKFNEIINAQGRKKNSLNLGKFHKTIIATHDGTIKKINNHLINRLGRTLGCPLDKSAGLYLYKHLGDKVRKGDKIITLFAESQRKLKEALILYGSSKSIIY